MDTEKHTPDTLVCWNVEGRNIYIPQSILEMYKSVFHYDLTPDTCLNYVMGNLNQNDIWAAFNACTDKELSANTILCIIRDMENNM